MFPVLLIAIGLAVLAFGKRLAVLGAAVGALLGLTLLRFIPGASNPWLGLIIVGLLAVIGFFVSGFAKGIVNIVIIALGALAGAVITLSFLDLLNIDLGLLDWLLALIGAVIGVALIQRFKDWAVLILAGLIGALLVVHGLSSWFSVLDGVLGTLVVLVLAGLSIVYQGGLLGGKKTAAGGSAG